MVLLGSSALSIVLRKDAAAQQRVIDAIFGLLPFLYVATWALPLGTEVSQIPSGTPLTTTGHRPIGSSGLSCWAKYARMEGGPT
jgi:hypothetical protein